MPLQLGARSTAILSGNNWILPALGLFWGSSYLWIDILNRAFDPTMVIMIQVATASAILVPVMRLRRSRLPQFGAAWAHILVITVFAELIPLGLVVWSQHYVDSSVASVLSATIPLFTLLIAALVFRSESITRERLIGILVGFLGVVTLSGANSSQGGLLNPGIIAVMLSSICYGFGFVYARRYMRGDPFGIVTLQMLLSTLLISPFALTLGDVDRSAITGSVILAGLVLGIISSGLGYCIYYMSLERLGPTTTSYGTYLSPVVAIVLGWVVLGETIGPTGFAGILLIIVGILTAAGLAARLIDRLRDREVEPALGMTPEIELSHAETQ